MCLLGLITPTARQAAGRREVALSHEAGGGNEKGLALDGIFFWARLGKEGALPYICIYMCLISDLECCVSFVSNHLPYCKDVFLSWILNALRYVFWLRRWTFSSVCSVSLSSSVSSICSVCSACSVCSVSSNSSVSSVCSVCSVSSVCSACSVCSVCSVC